MHETVVIRKTLAVGSDRVWTAIAGVGGLDRWFPIISACRVEGEGVGALRILTLRDGGEMRDWIVEIDDAARRLRYERRVLPFPVENYRGAVLVRSAARGADVSWTIDYDVAEPARAQISALVFSAISDGLDGLEKELAAQNPTAGRTG